MNALQGSASASVVVTLPDGSRRTLGHPVSVLGVAQAISSGLARNTVAVVRARLVRAPTVRLQRVQAPMARAPLAPLSAPRNPAILLMR